VSRIFLVAGESSGDMHGANLVRALREADPAVTCEGIGGRAMAEAGMHLRFDLAGYGIMGFTEVVRSLGTIRHLFHDTLECLRLNRPDCLVVIDYPGFNIRLAQKAYSLGIPIVYYISPQVWAWKKKRIHIIANIAKKVLVILPFEEELYRDIGAPCTYVGHPLIDQIESTPLTGAYKGGLVIGLLPGSREQEIRRLVAPMIATARGIKAVYPNARFVVPCVNEDREAQVRELAGDFVLESVVGKTYEVLSAARFCLVASGTATLETALFRVPMIILYKVSWLSYRIAMQIVDIEHIGLVNILAGERVVPEFVQGSAIPARILPVALELIGDTPARARMLDGLDRVRDLLKGAGASRQAAAEILAVAEGSSGG